MNNCIKIAITGGIGSGKSIISQVLRHLGYVVFDCDKEAKRLMAENEQIRQFLLEEITDEAFDESGALNSRAISAIIFNNECRRNRLNSVVHRCVKEEFLNLAKLIDAKLIFVETAILYQSGMDTLVDYIINVRADEETRIKRVMLRNGVEREDVVGRMNAQRMEEEFRKNDDMIDLCNITHEAHLHRRNISKFIITNDYTQAILPQLFKFLKIVNSD